VARKGAAPPLVAAEEGKQARHLGQHRPAKEGATGLLPWSRHGCYGVGGVMRMGVGAMRVGGRVKQVGE